MGLPGWWFLMGFFRLVANLFFCSFTIKTCHFFFKPRYIIEKETPILVGPARDFFSQTVTEYLTPDPLNILWCPNSLSCCLHFMGNLIPQIPLWFNALMCFDPPEAAFVAAILSAICEPLVHPWVRFLWSFFLVRFTESHAGKDMATRFYPPIPTNSWWFIYKFFGSAWLITHRCQGCPHSSTPGESTLGEAHDSGTGWEWVTSPSNLACFAQEVRLVILHPCR